MCVDKISDVKPTFQVNYLGNLSTTPAKILSANPRRRAVWVAGNSGNGIYVHFGPASPPTGNPGALIVQTNNGLLFDFATFGNAMQQELWATSQAATPSYVISEFIDASPLAPLE